MDNQACLYDFLFRARTGRLQDASEQTIERAAQVVERVLEGKNPLPKQKGRPSDPDTMWLCFHMISFPTVSDCQKTGLFDDRCLPLHLEGGFLTVKNQLNIPAKTVGKNYYKARKLLETAKGRQEYIDWLNHREKRWAAHLAKPPREYAFSFLLKGMICLKIGDSGEELIAPLSPGEVDSLAREAQKLLENNARAKEDRKNWLSCRDQSLFVRALLFPPKAGRKRANI
jgi:hypothetical protein